MFVESPFQKTHHLAPELVDYGPPGIAKPFLKWVGGKTQLIEQLDSNVPPELRKGLIENYVEPFVGGGSFFFHIAQKYQVKNLVIADSNQDLILAYWTIKDRVGSLIVTLQDIQSKYLSLSDSDRQDYYYQTRQEFNENKLPVERDCFSDAFIQRTAQLIFLNKTCFNGLFRVNASGLFNVAFGRYENPKICDPNNLIAVSQILERTQILLGDFTCVKSFMNASTFAYLDPPYRPLTTTANFTGYSPGTFTEADQQRLAEFCQKSSGAGARLMISNSDPENIDSSDTYFADNYPGYRIVRALANRMVNCKADRRGKISELIIMNYPGTLEVAAGENESPPPASKAAALIYSNRKETPVKQIAENKTASKRNAAALGAFRLLHDRARDGSTFNIDDLQEATGWKLQTARTYLSKKWKEYLEPSEDQTRPGQFKVRPSFLSLNEQSFLHEFSQVLVARVSKPDNIHDAKAQALAALANYADLLHEANSDDRERIIRELVERIRET